MRPLQVIHAVVTLLLLVAVLGFGLLALTGTVEVRLPTKERAGERPAAEDSIRPAVNPVGAKARLLVVRGAKPGMEYPIFEGPNVIGRADQKPVEIDLEFQESPERIWSSRQHAVITCDDGALVIEDLNSSNGTYVNRSRVPPGKKQELKANDLIQIGEVQLKVLL
ncbi:MAG: FHA domain-containing protein [Planctomycetes bacterium]|nr:FHA domain-containing protein [Planctomycetota bacterium]